MEVVLLHRVHGVSFRFCAVKHIALERDPTFHPFKSYQSGSKPPLTLISYVSHQRAILLRFEHLELLHRHGKQPQLPAPATVLSRFLIETWGWGRIFPFQYDQNPEHPAQPETGLYSAFHPSCNRGVSIHIHACGRFSPRTRHKVARLSFIAPGSNYLPDGDSSMLSFT